MIKEFFESLKLKDLVFFVLIIVLFMMVLKKNKKEGFATPYVYTASDFKTKVETALGDNLTAIQNLGDFAGQLITANNKLDLSGVELKVKSLEVKNDLTVQNDCTINKKITVKGGGEFTYTGNPTTAQYHFEDAEKAGRLRVGAAWGVVGIFSEDGDLMVASKGGKTIKFQNNASRVNANGTISIGSKKVLKADDVIQLHGNNHHSNAYVEICGNDADCDDYNVTARIGGNTRSSSYFKIKA